MRKRKRDPKVEASSQLSARKSADHSKAAQKQSPELAAQHRQCKLSVIWVCDLIVWAMCLDQINKIHGNTVFSVLRRSLLSRS